LGFWNPRYVLRMYLDFLSHPLEEGLSEPLQSVPLRACFMMSLAAPIITLQLE